MTIAQGYIDDITGSGYGELVDAILEYVPDLQWPTCIDTYSRMRTDPQISGVLAAYCLPIQRASWSLDPSGCRDEVVQWCADQFGLPILGDDPKPTGARRRGLLWGQHLKTALLAFVYGHMAFERVYTQSSSGLLEIDYVQERMPRTIASIHLDARGDIDYIKQHNVSGRSESPKIPASALVWYSHNREGANWVGRSLLRSSYAPWLIKHELWRVHATSVRRFGMGVPSVEAPPGATPAQVLEAQRLASAMRGGDQAGAGLPPGFRLAITGITGSVPDALGFIKYLDQQITHSTLTGILDLGSTDHGSRALGDSFLDLFLLSLQTGADDFAQQATSQLAVPLVDLNWGENEAVPRIVSGDVGAHHAVTAESLSTLLSCGALSFDPGLEEYVRREYKLPERKPTSTPTPTVLPKPLSASAKPNRRVSAASGLRRTPTDIEAASKADFGGIQADWANALDALETDWATLAADQRKQIEDAIAAAAEADDIAALADLRVDNAEAASVTAKWMETLAEDSAARAADELAEQGATTGSADVDSSRLSAVAQVTSGLLASGLVALATRTALQVWAPGAGSAVTTAVRSALDGLTGAALRDSLGAALSAAQNEGRVAAFEASDSVLTYYASEILDNATCSACGEVDGHEYTTLDEARSAYANGGYSECEGGLRCRGILVAVAS